MTAFKKTPPLNPAVTDPPGRWRRACLAVLALSAMGLAACTEDTTDSGEADQDQEEQVGTAEQAVSQTCVTLFRGGGTAVRDTYIKGGPQTGHNYGSLANMELGYGRLDLLQFELSGIPQGSIVTSATLSMKAGFVLPNHGTYPSAVNVGRAVNYSWTEASTTWTSFAQAYSSGPTSFGTITENLWATADVTEIVGDWVSGQTINRGFVLSTTPQNVNQVMYWDSSEAPTANRRPRLEVCYYPNLCASNPCQNGGSCEQTGGSYTCSCPAGTSGTHCEIAADPCAQNQCKNGSSCSPDGASYTCTCSGNLYYGDRCQFYDVCSSGWGSLICLNGGTCQTNPDPAPGAKSWSCGCPQGFSGPRCEVAACPCGNVDAAWNRVLKIPGVETIPTGAASAFNKCNANTFDASTSRSWFPVWMFPTLSASYRYIDYLNYFYQSSPHYCRWVSPYYGTVTSFSNPGVLTVMDDPGTFQGCLDPYNFVFVPTTPVETAACKTQVAGAPHVVPQTLPDIPLPIALGAPTLLALAGLLRRRFGRKVAK